MGSQKIGSIKVPQFDKENHNLWKKKMTLFIKASNPMYMSILHTSPHIPKQTIPENVAEDGTKVPEMLVDKEVRLHIH